MIRDSVGAPGFTVVWPAEATPTGASSAVEIDHSLDMLQVRLDAVEKHLARLAPQAAPAAHHERELREIRRQLADLTADVLGADHPLVAPLQIERISHERPHFAAAPVECTPDFWLVGMHVH